MEFSGFRLFLGGSGVFWGFDVCKVSGVWGLGFFFCEPNESVLCAEASRHFQLSRFFARFYVSQVRHI